MFGGGWLVFEKGEFEVFFPLGKEKRQDKGDPRGGVLKTTRVDSRGPPPICTNGWTKNVVAP